MKLILPVLAALAVASPVLADGSKLTDAKVQKLADAAVRRAYSAGSYERSPYEAANFDAATHVWSVEYYRKAPKLDVSNRFRVFVDDATSRVEVTCPGAWLFGGAQPEPDRFPEEVRPFIPDDDSPAELYCADLNDDGRPDFLLVTLNQYKSTYTLLILLRDSTGKLSLAVSNRSAVQSPMDDAGHGGHQILVRHNRFEIINTSAGSVEGASLEYCFEYSAAEHTWILTCTESTDFAYDSDTQQESKRYDFQGPQHVGHVTLDRFEFPQWGSQ